MSVFTIIYSDYSKFLTAENTYKVLSLQTGIRFTEEPKYEEVEYGKASEAVFHCHYWGKSEGKLQWVINSTLYNSSQQLPPRHHYKDSTHTHLIVSDIQLWDNGTTYQCQLPSNIEQPACVYRSAIGALIIKSKGKFVSIKTYIVVYNCATALDIILSYMLTVPIPVIILLAI